MPATTAPPHPQQCLTDLVDVTARLHRYGITVERVPLPEDLVATYRSATTTMWLRTDAGIQEHLEVLSDLYQRMNGGRAMSRAVPHSHRLFAVS